MDAQLKKGILEMCILHTLQKEDMYGYDVMKYMSAFFPEGDESTIYAILRRLNKEGLTEVYEGQTSNGPTRKYYRILDKGVDRLNQSISDWKRILSIIDEIGIK